MFRLSEKEETGLDGAPLPPVEIYGDCGRSGNRLYLNSGDNPSFPRCLAFGGELYQFTPRKTTSTGIYGFSVSPDMQSGTSAECMTYDNPTLPAAADWENKFALDCVEVWATEPDFKLSVEEQYEIARKMGNGYDASTDFVLQSAGIAQNKAELGIDATEANVAGAK